MAPLHGAPMLLRSRGLLALSLSLPILLAGAARAHPFVDMVPAPSASVSSGSMYEFVLVIFPGPLHFSIEGGFSPSLEAFGAFPVAEITLVAAEPGGELLLADSSYIEALEFGKPVVFDDFFSAVPSDDVVAHVVPEPSAVPSLALLAALGRARRR